MPGDTLNRSDPTFGTGTKTARRYGHEGIDGLAAPAPSLATEGTRMRSTRPITANTA